MLLCRPYALANWLIEQKSETLCHALIQQTCIWWIALLYICFIRCFTQVIVWSSWLRTKLITKWNGSLFRHPECFLFFFLCRESNALVFKLESISSKVLGYCKWNDKQLSQFDVPLADDKTRRIAKSVLLPRAFALIPNWSGYISLSGNPSASYLVIKWD